MQYQDFAKWKLSLVYKDSYITLLWHYRYSIIMGLLAVAAAVNKSLHCANSRSSRETGSTKTITLYLYAVTLTLKDMALQLYAVALQHNNQCNGLISYKPA